MVTAAGGVSAKNPNDLFQYIVPSPSGINHTTATNTSAVQINGMSQTVGTVTTATNTSGRDITTVTVDTNSLRNPLTSAGTGSVVTIPVNSGNSDAACVLSGGGIQLLQGSSATLVVSTPSASYILPSSCINLDSVSSQLGAGASPSNIQLSVTISSPSSGTLAAIQETAAGNGITLLSPPVDFGVSCSYGGNTVDINSFNGYVARTITIPGGTDTGTITGGAVLEPDGSFSHVPTFIHHLNSGSSSGSGSGLVPPSGSGIPYPPNCSMLFRPGNSTYVLISHKVEFKDVANHWAKDAINAMGSSLIVNGDENGNYNPDHNMTRAEFAAAIVRALGLKVTAGASSFSDVKSTDWFSGYVNAAASFGIINGYDAAAFGPNDTITREQAMAMIFRATKLIELDSGLTNGEAASLIGNFSDGQTVSGYATDSVAACLKLGIVNGKSSSTIAPSDFVTRAEVAVMIQRMLQKADLK